MLSRNRQWLLIAHKIAVSTCIRPHWLDNVLLGHNRNIRLLVSNNVVALQPGVRRCGRLRLISNMSPEK
jgi:hypothetical protein